MSKAPYTSPGQSSVTLPFPLETNRLSAIRAREPHIFQGGLAPSYPIADAPMKRLLGGFLEHKRRYGNDREQDLYREMSLVDFVDRLLRARPLAFVGAHDTYLLVSGEHGNDGRPRFDGGRVIDPTLSHTAPLLSYDEMALAALLGISVDTPFINGGERGNQGRIAPRGSYIPRGIYVGLVGARFERAERMEYRHILITNLQNIEVKGYGIHGWEGPQRKLLALWADYYGIGQCFPSFNEAQADHLQRGKESDYYRLNAKTYFHKRVYRQRMRAVLRPLLLEAQVRGAEAGRPVYLHLVGLGLGVWAVAQEIQGHIIVEETLALLRELSEGGGLGISDLDFSWFPSAVASRWPTSVEVSGGRIAIHYTRNAPAEWTPEKREGGKLLVATFAWDGNAYPGNEYWMGQLAASGDPAAMACSAVAELGNPLLNADVCGARIRWRGTGGTGDSMGNEGGKTRGNEGGQTGGGPREIRDPSALRALHLDRFYVRFQTAKETEPRLYPLRDYQRHAVGDWQQGGHQWCSMLTVDRRGIHYHAHGEIGLIVAFA